VAGALLVHHGALPVAPTSDLDLELPMSGFAGAVHALLRAGWRVEAGDRAIRALTRPSVRIVSGQDWFDLEGSFDFDGLEARLPEILRAVRAGGIFVPLGDGVDGVLPESWIERLEALAPIGTAEGDALRFQPHHVLLLDALLAEPAMADVDAGFERLRRRLRRAARISQWPRLSAALAWRPPWRRSNAAGRSPSPTRKHWSRRAK
jgi:hypothetical protein